MAKKEKGNPFKADLANELRKDLTIKHAGRVLKAGTTEVVPDPPRGKLVGAFAAAPASIDRLREQYRDALEAERRAGAKRRNAKQTREAAEESLVRARMNENLLPADEVRIAGRVTDALIQERSCDAALKAAKKDLKAAALAYGNHVDEEL